MPKNSRTPRSPYRLPERKSQKPSRPRPADPSEPPTGDLQLPRPSKHRPFQFLKSR